MASAQFQAPLMVFLMKIFVIWLVDNWERVRGGGDVFVVLVVLHVDRSWLVRAMGVRMSPEQLCFRVLIWREPCGWHMTSLGQPESALGGCAGWLMTQWTDKEWIRCFNHLVNEMLILYSFPSMDYSFLERLFATAPGESGSGAQSGLSLCLGIRRQ